MSDKEPQPFSTKQLLKLFSGSFLIRISYTLFGFLNSILLARLLGAENYGVYIFALSIVALLSVPTQFGMPTLVVREFAAFQAKQQWQFMKGLALRSHQFVVLVSLLICSIAASLIWLNPYEYSASKQQTLLVSLLLVPVLSLGALRDAMLRGLRYVICAQLPESFIRPFLLMICLIAISFLSPVFISASQVMVYYLACSFFAFIIGWFLYAKIKPYQLGEVSPKFLNREWVHTALPIGLTGGMQVINAQLSIVLLGFYLGNADIAFYRVAVLGSSFVVIILQIVDLVVAPEFSKLIVSKAYRELEGYIAKINKLIVFTTLPIVIVIVFAGSWLLSVFYGEQFVSAYLPLIVLAVGQAFNALLGPLAMLLNMAGHQEDVTYAMAAAFIINVVSHLMLIPTHGLLGAAIASSIMLIIWNTILWLRVKQRLGIKYYV